MAKGPGSLLKCSIRSSLILFPDGRLLKTHLHFGSSSIEDEDGLFLPPPIYPEAHLIERTLYNCQFIVALLVLLMRNLAEKRAK